MQSWMLPVFLVIIGGFLYLTFRMKKYFEKLFREVSVRPETLRVI